MAPTNNSSSQKGSAKYGNADVSHDGEKQTDAADPHAGLGHASNEPALNRIVPRYLPTSPVGKRRNCEKNREQCSQNPKIRRRRVRWRVEEIIATQYVQRTLVRRDKQGPRSWVPLSSKIVRGLIE